MDGEGFGISDGAGTGAETGVSVGEENDKGIAGQKLSSVAVHALASVSHANDPQQEYGAAFPHAVQFPLKSAGTLLTPPEQLVHGTEAPPAGDFTSPSSQPLCTFRTPSFISMPESRRLPDKWTDAPRM